MIGRLEVLVEELSCERFLRCALPRIVPDVPFEIRTFNGKPDLLRKLPARLRGYSHMARTTDLGIVVVIDRDNDDCIELKNRLDRMAEAAGLVTASGVAPGEQFDVLNRIVVEELEAWFFGDTAALRAAFPRLPAGVGQQARYRDPDGISGGTAEALEQLLQRHGYAPGGLAKVRTADDVVQHMDVEVNTSRSFQHFRDGVRRLSERSGA